MNSPGKDVFALEKDDDNWFQNAQFDSDMPFAIWWH